MAAEPKKIMVIGGVGALGSALIEFFKSETSWIASIAHGKNDLANQNIVLDESFVTMEEQASHIEKELRGVDNDLKFDGIICVAGGWAGGNISSDEFLKNADLMWKQNVQSSLIAAYLSGKYLKEGGLLVLTGAKAILGPSPGMVGYGMSKAAVHHLTQSLGSEGGGLPKNSKALAILPGVLDTPNNRKWMPGADYDTWTPLVDVAKLINRWVNDPVSGPQNGSLVCLVTKNGVTSIEID